MSLCNADQSVLIATCPNWLVKHVGGKSTQEVSEEGGCYCCCCRCWLCTEAVLFQHNDPSFTSDCLSFLVPILHTTPTAQFFEDMVDFGSALIKLIQYTL